MLCSDHVDELYRLIRSPADALFRPRGRAVPPDPLPRNVLFRPRGRAVPSDPLPC